MQLSIVAFSIVAVTMLAYVLPIQTVIIIGLIVSFFFLLAYMLNRRHPLLFRARRKWQDCRQDFSDDGIIKEEEVKMEVAKGFRRVWGRRIGGTTKRGRGYLLLTNNWFIVFFEDIPLVYIPHKNTEVIFDLGVTVSGGKLKLDVRRYEEAQLGRCLITIKTDDATVWLEVLAPE